MSTSEATLKKIAALACIKLNEHAQSQLTKDVSAIMNFVEALRSMDTKGVKPLLHPLDIQQPLRPDESLVESQVKALEGIAPYFKDGHYWVPKVIDTGK